MANPNEKRYQTRSDLARRRILEETVVAQLRLRTVHGLDDHAAWLLRALEQPSTVSELCARIVVEDWRRPAMARRLERFVGDLVSLELAEECDLRVGPQQAAPAPPSLHLEPGAGFEPTVLWSEEIRQTAFQTSATFNPGQDGCPQA